jgi:hypothetical protein
MTKTLFVSIFFVSAFFLDLAGAEEVLAGLSLVAIATVGEFLDSDKSLI